MLGKTGPRRIRLLGVSLVLFSFLFRTGKAGLKSLRSVLFSLTLWRTHPMAQAYPGCLPVPRGLGGAGSRESWRFSPSLSGESLEPASASPSRCAQGASSGPGLTSPGFPRVQFSSCFAFAGEDTRHSEATTPDVATDTDP